MKIKVTDELVEEMANRFLSWDLPKDFSPDCHISFDRDMASYNQHSWPSGTNLFHASQAKEMVRHMLGLNEERGQDGAAK